MSKCWYCNNELTTGDNPKHFGICNKCYDEMYKSGDTIIRSLTDKIAELQKQLKSQPKEVVEKIRKTIKDDLVYPDNRIDCSFDNGYQGEETLCSVLDKVLKEYDK